MIALGSANACATGGWPWWKAVSKQATCGNVRCRAAPPDRRDVVRLVQRRERNERLERRDDVASTRTGADVFGPPCTTRWPTATSRCSLAVLRRSQSRQDGERAVVPERLARGPLPFTDRRAVRIACDELRRIAELLDAAAHPPGEGGAATAKTSNLRLDEPAFSTRIALAESGEELAHQAWSQLTLRHRERNLEARPDGSNQRGGVGR